VAETRKLAAIVVFDMVGYSRLAGADEERILARLRALRSDLIDSTVAVHNGRVRCGFGQSRREADEDESPAFRVVTSAAAQSEFLRGPEGGGRGLRT
jgi:class 3 adenylate cyclase